MKKQITSLAIILLTSMSLHAQAPPPPPLGDNAPIDQGIVFLAIVSIAYGIYRKTRLAFR